MTWEWHDDEPNPRLGCAVVVMSALAVIVTAWSVIGGWW